LSRRPIPDLAGGSSQVAGVYAANAAAVYHDRGILPYRRVALMFQRQIFVRAGLERVRWAIV